MRKRACAGGAMAHSSFWALDWASVIADRERKTFITIPQLESNGRIEQAKHRACQHKTRWIGAGSDQIVTIYMIATRPPCLFGEHCECAAFTLAEVFISPRTQVFSAA